ncbi:hypothetical protein OS187_04100 [Xanthomonadaceae bacterium JHOS43]|nr:hypothetical protein [Xanthomonadaceae bacterium JHOS43]
MKFFISIICVYFFLCTPLASARDLECRGCSYSAMSNQATSLGKGHHRIYDLSAGLVYGFHVRCSNEVVQGNGSEPASRALTANKQNDQQVASRADCAFAAPLVTEEYPLSNQELQSFAAIHDYYVAGGMSFSSDIAVDLKDFNDVGSFGDSVIPVMFDNVRRGQLFDYIYAKRTTGVNSIYDFVQVLEKAALAHFQILPNQVIVTVIFKNGSQVNLKYSAADGKLDLIKGTARDPAGNAVIEGNDQGSAGHYPIVGNTLAEYLDYLNLIGVPVTNGSGTTLTCTWNGVTLSCYVQTLNN